MGCERSDERNPTPLAKPSLLPMVRCTLRRAERGNAARSRLYFVGYVIAVPEPSYGLRHTERAPELRQTHEVPS
jgi:hypothetical protein